MSYKNLKTYKRCMNNEKVDESQLEIKKICVEDEGYHLCLFFIVHKKMMKFT